MKILTLNWGGRNTGSIDSIINCIDKQLLPIGFDFLHVYESGAFYEKPYKRLSGYFMSHFYYYWAHISGRRYCTGRLPALKFIRILNNYSPDIVHIHCPNGFSVDIIYIIKYLKFINIPTVITNHAEFFYTGSCPHSMECMKFTTGCAGCSDFHDKCCSYIFNRSRKNWLKMKEAFDGASNINMVVVSPWQASRIKLSPITSDLSCTTILNGIDCSIFKYIERENESSDYLRILHVTSCFSLDPNELKGGHFIFKLAKLLENWPVKFFVVGNIHLHSDISIPSNIAIIGRVDEPSSLAEYYRKADITLTVSKRETFGMVCAESLCCGTPVMGFENGGSESISLEGYSQFFKYGDLDSLSAAICNFTPLHADAKRILSILAQEKYSQNTMASKYHDLYAELAKP